MTDMTQAPTPGPLMVGDYAVRLEDHPLVKAGEVHRVTEMFRGGYLGFARPVGGEWNPSGWRKCDADGWITWSGGENPVPGQNVEAKWRDGRVFIGPSDDVTFFDWRHLALASGSDIIAFRLAPTAPVEASGSERDHRFVPGVMRCAKCNFVVVRRVFSAIDGTVGDGDNKTEPCPNGCGPLWPMTWEQNSRDMEERCEAAVLEAANLRAQLALRPQPSGETREQVAEIIEAAIVRHDPAIPLDSTLDDADRILALIRPAPVASGDQHSSGEGK